MKALLPLFGLMLILILSSCNMKMYTMDDYGKEITIKRGEQIKIKLPGNPMEGKNWRKLIYDPKVIQRQGRFDYKIGNETVGEGGDYYFKWLAVDTGYSQLYMEYGNRHDLERSHDSSFVLNIRVILPESKDSTNRK